MNNYYFINNNNEQQGPYSVEELMKYINPETNVWCEGMEYWAPAKGIAELNAYFHAQVNHIEEQPVQQVQPMYQAQPMQQFQSETSYETRSSENEPLGQVMRIVSIVAFVVFILIMSFPDKIFSGKMSRMLNHHSHSSYTTSSFDNDDEDESEYGYKSNYSGSYNGGYDYYNNDEDSEQEE